MKIICAHYALVVAMMFDAAQCKSLRGDNEVDSVNEKLMKCCRTSRLGQKSEENGDGLHMIRIVVEGTPIYGYGKVYASPRTDRNLRSGQNLRSNKQLLFYPHIKPAPSRSNTPFKPWGVSDSRPPSPLWEPFPGEAPPGPPKPFLAGISRKFRRHLRLGSAREGNYGSGQWRGSMASSSKEVRVEPNDVSQNQQEATHLVSAVSVRNFENHRTSPSNEVITGIVDRDHISTLVSSSILVRGH